MLLAGPGGAFRAALIELRAGARGGGGGGGGGGAEPAMARHGGQQLCSGRRNCRLSLNCCILHDANPRGGGEWRGGGVFTPDLVLEELG